MAGAVATSGLIASEPLATVDRLTIAYGNHAKRNAPGTRYNW